MALFYHVRCNVSIKVMDVVVLDAIGKGFQPKRYIHEGASFKSSRGEVPLLLALTVGEVDRVLKMKKNGPNYLSRYKIKA